MDNTATKKGLRVLFVTPPILLPRIFAHYPTFSNLGALYNAALLEREGWDVSFVDGFFHLPRLTIRPCDEDLTHVGLELPEMQQALSGRSADVIVLVMTMFSDVYKLHETYVAQVATLLSQELPGTPIIAADCHVCGMNYFPFDPISLMQQVPQLHGVVIGEGDYKLRDALQAFATGHPPQGIPDVTWKSPDGPVTNGGKHPLVQTLDELPAPAFHLLNMENYFTCMDDAVRADLVHEYHSPRRFLPLMTSRGCNFSCSFCTQQVLSLPWRGHSVEYLTDMIARLQGQYDIDVFFFIDNNINVSKRRFRALVEFMSAHGWAWDAVNGFRADFLDEEDVALLKKAGNAKVTISAESGDATVLKGVVGKRLDLKHIVKVVKAADEVGLPSQVHYVIGMPGETRQAINRTLEFAGMLYEMYRAWPLLQHAIPFRGTDLYRECRDKGYFITDPDEIPTHELERRHLIKTPEFNPDEVMRFKNNFRMLMDIMDTHCVVELPSGDNNQDLTAAPSRRGSPDELKADTYLHLLEKERSRGARDLLIHGGEPLLLPDTLVAILQKATVLGYQNKTLVTNGRMLAYSNLVGALMDAGLNGVNVTLHSANPQIHDDLTQVKGSQEQTLRGLRNVILAGMPRIDVSIGLTRTTLPGLAQTLSFLVRHRLRSFHLMAPQPRGRTLDRTDLIVPYPVMIPALEAVLRAYPRLDLSVQGLPFCLLSKDLRNKASPLPFFLFPQLRQLKAKHGLCSGCTEFMLCLGFWRERFEPFYQQFRMLGVESDHGESAD